MNKKQIFSGILIFLGEALIIISFLYFGRNLPTCVMILNIVITSIIYLNWFVERFIPAIDLQDKAHKDAGSLGLKWLFTVLYSVIAIGAMLVFNLGGITGFYVQIIIHAILFFLLLVGLYFVFFVKEKVGEVYYVETGYRSRINEMNTSLNSIKLKLELMENVPTHIIMKVRFLNDGLRFISPSNNDDAAILEAEYLAAIKKLNDCLYDNPLNEDRVGKIIQKCEQIYQQRRQVYSK